MNKNIFGEEFWKEIETEIVATRKCLERIDEKFFNYNADGLPFRYRSRSS